MLTYQVGLEVKRLARAFIHISPYFVYVSSEHFGEFAHLHKLTLPLAARRCNRYQNLISWPINK